MFFMSKIRTFNLALTSDSPEIIIANAEDILNERRTADLSTLSAQEQFDLLQSRAFQILPGAELLQRLESSKASGRALRIKLGIDPTGADVHLGHAIPMMFLSRFQRMGHQINFIIGDFTAKIGDPSGRVDSRPPLDDAQILKNLSTYKEQVRPFFDIDRAHILHNGTWLAPVNLRDMIATFSKIPVSAILQRDDFRTRLENGDGLTMAEIIYPIVMGMDSVFLEQNRDQYGCDVEMGGKDQFLNMQMCRRLMENEGLTPECTISTGILEGTTGDGRKMSKSLGNYVGLSQSAEEIYGRIMSIPDSSLEHYYKYLTEIFDSEWEILARLMAEERVNPIQIKKLLARIIVQTIHGAPVAIEEDARFIQKFSKKDYDSLEGILEKSVTPETNILTFLAENEMVSSKTEGRRILLGGGIQVIRDNEIYKLSETHIEFRQLLAEFGNSFILKVGKRNLVRVTIR